MFYSVLQLSRVPQLPCVVQTLGKVLDPEHPSRLLLGFPLGEGSLRDVLRHHKHSDHEIGERFLEAVCSLHSSGYVHGDIKPDNALLMKDGALVLCDLETLTPVNSIRVQTGTGGYRVRDYYNSQKTALCLGDDVFASGLVLMEIYGVPIPRKGHRSAAGLQRAVNMLPQHLQALVSSMVQRYHFGRPTLAEVRAQLEEARQRRGRRSPTPPTTPLSNACQLTEEEGQVRSVKRRRRREAKEQVLCKRVRSKRCADGRGGGLQVGIFAAKYWSTDAHGDWFHVWWLGEENRRGTLETRGSFSQEQQVWLDVLKRKGNGARVQRTVCGGNGTTVESVGPFNHSGRLPYLVHHRAKVDACVPMALLNLLNASRSKKKKLMRVFGGGSGLGCLRELARVAGVLGLKLHRVNIDLVDLTCGREELFLVMRGVHCVGVDCQRGLIWDCFRETALELNTKNLLMCVGTTGKIAIRKVSP